MKYTIKNILLLLAGIAFAVPAGYMAYRVWSNVDAAKKAAAAEFEKITLKAARMCVEDAARACHIVSKADAAAYENASAAVREKIFSRGAAKSGGERIWLDTYAQNSPNAAARSEIPVLSFGDVSAAPSKTAGGAAANGAAIAGALAEIKRDTFLDVSLMSKIHESGTMARLATTLEAGGAPMIGSTFDDTAETSEITRTLLARKTYFGVARIGGVDYMCVYEPIIDQYGEVVGAAEFLKNFSSIKFVFDNFDSIRIGDDGYLWGLMLEGGKAVKTDFMRQPKFGVQQPDGDESANMEDGAESVQSIVDAALAAGDGKVSVRVDSGDPESDTITAFTYFKPWNIIIGATISGGNFDAGEKRLDASLEQTGTALIPLLVAMLVCALLFAARLAGAAESSVEEISKSIRAMQAPGEPSALGFPPPRRRASVSISELDRLRASTAMAANAIRAAAEKIMANADDFSKSAGKLFDKTSQLEIASEKKTLEFADIQSSLALISKTAEILDEDSSAAISGIEKSLAEMKEGSTLLSELEENARALIADSQSVALQLSVIKDKADKISAVVGAIKSVVERINTLAVNASIEAERAGDTSIGFKAVAVEITKLGDTTAAAAARISEMASAMCKSVNSGVGEMKDFAPIMQGCKESIKNVREAVSAALSTTLELSPKFGEISKGIAAHSENIANIGENLGKLSARSTEARNSIARLKYRASTATATVAAIKLKLKNFGA